MNFDFSEEQIQLREALVRLLDRGYEFGRRKQIIASGDAPAIRRRIIAMQETVETALAADQENLF